MPLAQSILKRKFPFVDKPLRIQAPSKISPSKRALEKYKPRGLFSEFYDILRLFQLVQFNKVVNNVSAGGRGRVLAQIDTLSHTTQNLVLSRRS